LQAAEIAKASEIDKLLLGHLSARYENGLEHEREARKIFENTQVVEDGDQYKF
jgi:ribonuclease Z